MTTDLMKKRLQRQMRPLPAPLPGPSLFHVKLADTIRERCGVRHHDDYALSRDSECLFEDLRDFLVGEVFKNPATEHRVEAVVCEWQRLQHVGAAELAGLAHEVEQLRAEIEIVGRPIQ